MKLLAKIILTLTLLLPISSESAGQVVEFGLTPSTVYGVWKNINKAVLTYAKESSTDKVWLKNLENMPQNVFSGKVPANVLEQVKQFNAKLNDLHQDQKIPSKEILLEKDLSNLLAASDNNLVTPSLVYLHSGQVLINLVTEIVNISPTDIAISRFFEVEAFTGKTPSDVFSLVDLGSRYLSEILTQRKNSNLVRKMESK